MRGLGARQDVPKRGTYRRTIFDLLQPGAVVSRHEILAAAPLKSASCLSGFISSLAITYDLDVRLIAPGKWCRVGEWKRGKYIDHVAPRFGATA